MLNNNMRPQDIAVLYKVIHSSGRNVMHKEMANALFISTAEVSNSLSRSMRSGLLDSEKKRVRIQAFTEFIIYGLPYVFSQMPGDIARGLPTAYSHPYFQGRIISETRYVWPDAASSSRGLALQPLYPNATDAAKADADLHLFLAIIDVLRIGGAREKEIAIQKLKEILP